MENLRPEEIEARSFAIITEELGDIVLADGVAPIVKRVIHTTADFEYARSLVFSANAVEAGRAALGGGGVVVTDTRMAMSGINSRVLSGFGGVVRCYIGDVDVGEEAVRLGCTRSRVAMEKAVRECGDGVYVIGNAPTALVRLCELVEGGEVRPRLVVGVPVGFVNVVESKEMLMGSGVEFIVARGRKGGSNVGAAIVNALLYGIDKGGKK